MEDKTFTLEKQFPGRKKMYRTFITHFHWSRETSPFQTSVYWIRELSEILAGAKPKFQFRGVRLSGWRLIPASG
jgi:hypothetical protein